MIRKANPAFFRWVMRLVLPMAMLLALSAGTQPTTLALGPQAPDEPTVTIITDDITTNTTWDLAHSPYEVVYNVTVQTGVTLKIAAGVEVRFRQSAGLEIDGILNAVGTPTQPITFTGVSHTPGYWNGLFIYWLGDGYGSGSTLDYVTVEYGGGGVESANLVLHGSKAEISHSLFRYSAKDGIYAFHGYADILATKFESNAGDAVDFSDGGVNPKLSNLSASGNGFNGIVFGGGEIQGDRTWSYLGMPYRIDGTITVFKSASLTVKPGVEVRFSQNVGLNVMGTLNAVGMADKLITFTAVSPTSGFWNGISIDGGALEQGGGSTLDYVTLEYGGTDIQSANLALYNVRTSISHSIIRHSNGDGVVAVYGGGTHIEFSQIVENAGYGVNNQTDDMVIATHNWWGDASGPQHAICNSTGKGSKVNGVVAVRPFLTSPDQPLGLFDPDYTLIMSINPLRWFVPADGTTRLWVHLTLTDGEGHPLPGRKMELASTLGIPVSGGVTDVQGQTYAYLTSDTTGDAELTASVEDETCAAPSSTPTKVTFTNTADDPLAPGAQAPYMADAMEFDPLPVTRGVPTHLRATLVNPNDFPILVDATFNVWQLGIGLTFGPVGEVTGQRIEAHSSGVFQVLWTPLISGHYCMEVQYHAKPVPGSNAPNAPLDGFSGQKDPFNNDVNGGALDTEKNKSIIDRAKTAIKYIKYLKFLISFWWDAEEAIASLPSDTVKELGVEAITDFNFEMWEKVAKEMGGDPPVQDYTVIAMPHFATVDPLHPQDDPTPAVTSAANALVTDVLSQTAYMQAAKISLERYSGASEAGDLKWASQQAAALIYYKRQMGLVMLDTADKIDALLKAQDNAGIQYPNITVDHVRAFQNRLRTQGWYSIELEAAQTMGWSDQELEDYRQEILADNPNSMVGSGKDGMQDLADILREWGNALVNPINFMPGGIPGVQAANETSRLVRIYDTHTTFRLGNPYTQTTTIQLSLRPLDLPANWTVSVTPISATLVAGQVITVTVNIHPGGPAVQGTIPRLAIEGYAGSTLVGGVVEDVMIPQQVDFNGKLKLFLPVTIK